MDVGMVYHLGGLLGGERSCYRIYVWLMGWDNPVTQQMCVWASRLRPVQPDQYSQNHIVEYGNQPPFALCVRLTAFPGCDSG